jgi:hypothetical protein
MTELARTLLRGIRDRGASKATRSDGTSVTSAIAVQVTVPTGTSRSAVTGLEHGLNELLSHRVADLGIERSISLHIAPARTARPAIDVSINSRPAACDVVAPANADVERWTTVVTTGVDKALRRRLSLLLDEAFIDQWVTTAVAAFRGEDPASLRDVPGYLVDNGISLTARDSQRMQPGAFDECETPFEIGEVILDAVGPIKIMVELAEETLRNTADDVRHDLLRSREKLFSEIGLRFPDVNLVISNAPPGQVDIVINCVHLPTIQLVPGAGWHEVVEQLHGVLRSHAHWFIRTRDVEAARDVLADAVPNLVWLSRTYYGAPLLTGCLRSLARSGETVRNLPRILWLLLEPPSRHAEGDVVRFIEMPMSSFSSRADVLRDPDVLACGLRKRVSAEAWRVGAAGGALAAARLSVELEAALLEPPDPAALAQAEWQAITAVGRADGLGQIVTHSLEAVRPVRNALSALPQPPQVVASAEFPPDVELPASVLS